MPAATLSEVRNQAWSLANASTTFGTKDNDLFNQNETDESAILRDLRVATAILETPGHPHHKLFTASTASGVASGTELLDHIGEVFNVKRTRTDSVVVQALLVPYRRLLRWQRNASSQYATANLKENYFALDSNLVHFVGGGSLSYQYRALSKLASLQSPVEYQHLIVVGVLADLYGKEALSETLSQFYNAQFDAGLAAIRQLMPPAPLEVKPQ